MSNRLVKEEPVIGIIEVYRDGMKVKVPNVAPKDLIMALLQLTANLIKDCVDNKKPESLIAKPTPEETKVIIN